MANRRYYNISFQLEPMVTKLYLHATFGSAGAVTIDAAQSRGIKSITHGGNGTYLIVLQDNYNRLLNVSHVAIAAAAPASPTMRVYDDSVSNASIPSLTVVFSSAGTDTDPASGEAMRMEITLKNSNA